MILVASETLLQHHALIRCMNQHHITVVERQLRDPVDLILDDRSCVVVRPSTLLLDEKSVIELADKIASRIEFEQCWLVFEFTGDDERLNLCP